MKNIFVAILLTYSFSIIASCPNLTGTYSKDLSPSDDRQSYTFKISQNSCDSITLSDWVVKFKSGREDKTPSSVVRVDLIDGQFHGRIKSSWLPDGIETLITDINTEHCNEHGMWKINQEKKSLDYIPNPSVTL